LGLNSEVIELLVLWARKQTNISKVHIFGSRVSGKNRKESDIDIAIELIEKFDNLAYWIQVSNDFGKSLSSLLPYEVDLQWYGGKSQTPTIDKALKKCSLQVYP